MKKKTITLTVNNIVVLVTCVIVLVFAAIFVFGDGILGRATFSLKGEQSSNQVTQALPDCPYECCVYGEGYKIKNCDAHYDCRNNRCIAIDTDNDGLTDIEELQIGTNPQSYDSDGDTLSDYQEVKILGTNPLNRNTDGDRYDDGVDINPTVKNTAVMKAEIIETANNINLANWAIIVLSEGTSLSTDPVVSTHTYQITINNVGNDYSSYINYNFILYHKIGDSTVKLFSQPINYGKLNVGNNFVKVIDVNIKASQLGINILRMIQQGFQSGEFIPRAENIEYEQFS